LAVVARAAAAHGDGNAARRASAHHARDLFFGLGARDDVSFLAGQFALEHGAKPRKILRHALHARQIVDPLDTGKVLNERAQMVVIEFHCLKDSSA
jgi:hypothetical protein